MTKDSDNTDNQDIVKALESIRGLLEKSESKLSAARASLKKAKRTETPASKIPVSNEPVVPVLDDVVLPSEDDEAQPSLLDIPAVIDIASNILDAPTPLPAGHTTEEVLEYLDNLQKDLEKHLHETLIESLVHIEVEIKQVLQDKMQKLREEIAENRKE